MSAGVCAMGPSSILELPNKFWIIIYFGCTFAGIGFCLSQVLFAPLMKNHLLLKYRVVPSSNYRLEKRLNDLNSLIFLISQTVGQMGGPMIGALMFEAFGHRTACDFYFLIFFAIAVLIVPFYLGHHPFVEAEEEKR